MLTAGIIAVGTELALGQTVDTNTAWLARELATLGIRAGQHVTVPDEADDIRAEALRLATSCDVLIITGGLGPTEDDLTRAALAAAAGVELEVHQPSVDHLREFFASRRRVMPERNLVQARLPRGAQVLANPCGTAPGFCVELGGTPCYVLPGVPFEMQMMFRNEVRPALAAQARGRVLRSRLIHTFGMGESDVGSKLADLMQRGRNPEVGTTAGVGVVSVRINALADSAAECDALLGEYAAEVRGRLGEVVFGEGDRTLAEACGELLVEAGQTVATAESCTGGLVSKLLTDAAGASRYFLGGVVCYANSAKEHVVGVPGALLVEYGAVSEPVAAALAEGAARAFGTDWAVSVTGIAGPSGGTAEKPVGLVFVGLHGPGGTRAEEYRFGTDWPREGIRIRSAYAVLNTLRLALVREQRGAERGGG